MSELRAASLDKLARKLTDLQPVLQAIGIEMARRTALAFDQHGQTSRGGPSWAPRRTPNFAGIIHDLSISANVRAHRFKRQPVLVDTGQLRNSISSQVRGDAVVWGASAPYAKAQQLGLPTTIPITPAIKRNALEAASKKEHARYAGLLAWIAKQTTITVRPAKREIIGFWPDDEAAVTEIVEDFVTEQGA